MDAGHLLADRYELTSHIARGGMADVWEARDRALNRRVAVKVLHAQFSNDESFVRRFRREAQAAAGPDVTPTNPIFRTGSSAQAVVA